jgi:hypothetical protein
LVKRKLNKNDTNMRRTLFVCILLALWGSTSQAQVAKQALGLRFGAGFGLGTEFTYQRNLTSLNRLELDLGFNSNYKYADNFRYDYNSWAVTGLYHWVKDLERGLKWYFGPGAKLGAWSSNQGYNYLYQNGLFLAVAGDIGMEYSFPARIQISMNARPELGIFNRGSGVNIGFAVRYQF